MTGVQTCALPISLLSAARNRKNFQSASLADKVIGKAAALLCAYMKVSFVYTPLVSEPALQMLKTLRIDIEADKVVGFITDRSGTAPCPLENLMEQVDDPGDAYRIIINHFKEDNEKYE